MIARTNRDGGNCEQDDCPTAYQLPDGRLVIQGDIADAGGDIRLGPGETAVIVPVELLRKALNAAV